MRGIARWIWGQRTASKAQPSLFVQAEDEAAEYGVMQNEHRDAQWVPQSYAELMYRNDYRERLLDDARRYSPISSVFHLNKLPETVLYRMAFFPITWIVVSTYVVLASLTRLGIIDLGDAVEDGSGAFDGAETLVTFMVVFYLGYCYSRHFEIYRKLEATTQPMPIYRGARDAELFLC